MGNVTLTLPDELHEALRQASKDEERVIAAVIRRAIAEYLLKNHNVKVEHTMVWGGNRHGSGEGKEE